MKHSVLKAIIGSKPLGVKNIFEYFALSSTCDEFFNSKGRVFLKPKELLVITSLKYTKKLNVF